MPLCYISLYVFLVLVLDGILRLSQNISSKTSRILTMKLNTEAILRELLYGDLSLSARQQSEIIIDSVVNGADTSQLTPLITDRPIPTTLEELNQTSSSTYDLSISEAYSLSIPVIGSVSGGQGRRVVILERKTWRDVITPDSTIQYGYSIRLAITTSKLDAGMKLGLAYLAASAQVGLIEGKWTLSTVGLSGVQIDKATVPPKELGVETFFLAQQSLEKLIEAVRDPTTKFVAEKVGEIKNIDQQRADYRKAIARAYALGRIERGRTLQQALDDLRSGKQYFEGYVVDFYRDFVGSANPTEPVPSDAQNRALLFLSTVAVNPRG